MIYHACWETIMAMGNNAMVYYTDLSETAYRSQLSEGCWEFRYHRVPENMLQQQH